MMMRTAASCSFLTTSLSPQGNFRLMPKRLSSGRAQLLLRHPRAVINLVGPRLSRPFLRV